MRRMFEMGVACGQQTAGMKKPGGNRADSREANQTMAEIMPQPVARMEIDWIAGEWAKHQLRVEASV